MNIILASASPRRAILFKQMKLDFEIDPSKIEEVMDSSLSPEKLVQQLAAQKGEDVAGRHKDSLIVAADTIVYLNDVLLGKPSDKDEAIQMLKKLSSNSHDVYSGVWVAFLSENGQIKDSFSFSERTNVTFSALSDQEIDYYVSTGNPLDKAGAYGIQDDYGALFVKKIDGDFYNVVGFPVNSFYQNLKRNMPVIHKKLFFNTDE